MPIVPRLDDVPETQLRGVSGGGGSRALGGASQRGQRTLAQIGAFAQQERERSERSTLLRHETEAVRTRVDLLHGEGGFLHTRGQGALDNADSARQAYSEALDAIKGRIPSTRLREAFELLAAEEVNRFENDVSRHLGTQRNVAADAQLANSIETTVGAVQAAALSGDVTLGPDGLRQLAVTQNLDILDRHLEAYAEANADRLALGPEEWLREARASARATAHESTVEALLRRGDDLTATAYLEAHADDMDTESLVGLTDLVAKAQAAGTELRAIETLVTSFYDPEDARDPVGGRTLAEMERQALEAADATIDDLEVRKSVRKGVRDRFRAERAQIELEQKDTFQEIMGELDRGVSPQRLEQDPRTRSLRPDQRRDLVKHLDTLARGRVSQGSDARFMELRRLALNEPDKFLAVDMTQEMAGGRLTGNDARTLDKLQLDLIESRNGSEAGNREIVRYQTEGNVIQTTMKSVGLADLLDLDLDDDDDKMSYAAVENRVYRALEERNAQVRAATGRDMDNVELEKAAEQIATGLAREIVTDRSPSLTDSVGGLFRYLRTGQAGINPFGRSSPSKRRQARTLTPDSIALNPSEDTPDTVLIDPVERRTMETRYRAIYGALPDDQQLRRFILEQITSVAFTPIGG